MKTFFITGTDTDVGKTYTSCKLLRQLKQQQNKTMACKPVAAGAFQNEHGKWLNEDALNLQQAVSEKQSYDEINPVVFRQAIAPHIAAAQSKQAIDIEKLVSHIEALQNKHADYLLVEGAGGWRVPFDEKNTLADLAKKLSMPVILVVDMRLGCLNHAVLTAQAVLSDGLPLAAWVANNTQTSKMQAYDENLVSLKTLLPAPCLGEVAYNDTPETAFKLEYLDEY